MLCDWSLYLSKGELQKNHLMPLAFLYGTFFEGKPPHMGASIKYVDMILQIFEPLPFTLQTDKVQWRTPTPVLRKHKNTEISFHSPCPST